MTIFSQPQFLKGMTYAGFQKEVFASNESDVAIQRLINTGTTWVAIAVGWYQKDQKAVEIFSHPSKTPSTSSLIHLIELLKKNQIKVFLKPFVDSLDHTWRAKFKPTSWNKWFNSYLTFILHYADLAEKYQLDLFSVGVENVLGNRKQQVYWKNIIETVKSVYHGPITYSANFDKPQSYKKVQFWDMLDYIGIDAYFSLASLKDPSLDHIIKCWNREIDKIDKWRKRKHPNKDILFTELGVSSYTGAIQKPWAHPPKETADWQEQADYYEAFFQSFQQNPWLKGVFWWWWDNPSTSDYIYGGKDYAYYYTPKGKRAEEVLRRYFGGREIS